jgi:CheY-like chemotaxis protein
MGGRGERMNQQKNFYRLTAEGQMLWARRGKLPLPLDYRRILGLVDFSGHREVIRSYLARYPEAMVAAWLEEFEQARLIESAPAKEPSLADLAHKPAAPPLEPEDIEYSAPEVSFADTSLTRLGIYTSYDRIANRPASRKKAAQTVALVVEDDPDQLALAVLRLTMGGYRTKTADSVQNLYTKLEEGLPDALFLDIGLPDGNGFDVLTALRQHPTYTYLPIIMLTAASDPADVARGLALGCDGYITKPYGPNTLEYVLRYVMKQEISAGYASGAGQSMRTVEAAARS